MVRQIVYANNNSDESVVARYLQLLKINNSYCVDIGAGDGMDMSNTNFLFISGWRGLAIESDEEKFVQLAERFKKTPGVKLVHERVTPHTIVRTMETSGVPKNPDFLNLDIDSYDFFVLEAILSTFRPTLICTEINDLIPPPLKFCVTYNDAYQILASKYFFGYSISMLQELCDKFDYAIIWLEFNNAFIVPKELIRDADDADFGELTPEQAYKKGFLDNPQRSAALPWSLDFDAIRKLPPQELVAWVHAYFAEQSGKFQCSL